MTRKRKRITQVTTRAGDSGTTSLADGSKLAKTEPRMHAIGAVDELNSFIGLLVTQLEPDAALAAPCARIQQELFDVGATLATVGAIPCPDNGWIDDEVQKLNASLPPLTEFVIPGGTVAAALAHVCRATCRRAERELWALQDDDSAAGAARYANRLSDLLFVMARTLNADAGSEPQWRGTGGPTESE
ncbi:MAG: cob(I)yrinic acid a,c-diamide adenosyltransferase [Pseudomonadales bacterium]|nr:cob(I)yrinic acid a,c-diamide adenosyltransferase [Pseudomonadales bacterium]NIX08957.1 cob(I)yrinic acid a,c-diamide adenosyltransferase [Pseudomonadales bacterium]